jgi:adenylyltransferase/sulfurtransferase
MNDQQLLRYNRQILLPQFGYEGQQKLLQSHVAIMGLGGLGSPAAMYLTAAGVGELTLVDFDVVETTNLQRQILHREENVGQAKTESARKNLLQLNPDIKLNLINHKLDETELHQLAARADVILDGTDNFASRFAINRACVAHGTPLISGAAIRFDGQIGVFDLRKNDSPCYRCLYDEQGNNDETCSMNGVIAPLVGVIGSLQALEAIKLIAGIGETLHGKLLVFDALHQEWRSMKLRRDPQCPVCNARK